MWNFAGCNRNLDPRLRILLQLLSSPVIVVPHFLNWPVWFSCRWQNDSLYCLTLQKGYLLQMTVGKGRVELVSLLHVDSFLLTSPWVWGHRCRLLRLIALDPGRERAAISLHHHFFPLESPSRFQRRNLICCLGHVLMTRPITVLQGESCLCGPV